MMSSTILKNVPGNKARNQTGMNRETTTDAVVILQKLFGSPGSDAYMIAERERVILGGQIYELRTQAGMTRSALAKKTGTTAEMINRLEDADYENHPFPLLRKIAAVFGTQLEIRFVPIEKNKPKKKTRNSSR
jgi:ribosome-binding protein aMBF1 (putative translation factor)